MKSLRGVAASFLLHRKYRTADLKSAEKYVKIMLK